MSTPPDMAERHTRVLARLTELGLALAEQTFEDAQAAETPAARIESVKAFHTVSRAVRQCVALEARLVRQQAQDERAEAAAPPRKPTGVDVARRIKAVRDGVSRVIWHEAEDAQIAEWMEEAMEDDIVTGCLRDDFCAEPLDDHIVRLCLSLDLPEALALNWRDLAPAPERSHPDDDDDDDDPEAQAAAPAAPPEPQPQSSA